MEVEKRTGVPARNNLGQGSEIRRAVLIYVLKLQGVLQSSRLSGLKDLEQLLLNISERDASYCNDLLQQEDSDGGAGQRDTS